ncbi:MAG: hypothetical protein ACR2MB_12705 [Acidimicrobiales bacterium]
MRRIEQALGMPTDKAVDTTTTLGHRRRLASVNQVVYLLLVAIVIADVVGCGIILTSR